MLIIINNSYLPYTLVQLHTHIVHNAEYEKNFTYGTKYVNNFIIVTRICFLGSQNQSWGHDSSVDYIKNKLGSAIKQMIIGSNM